MADITWVPSGWIERMSRTPTPPSPDIAQRLAKRRELAEWRHQLNEDIDSGR